MEPSGSVDQDYFVAGAFTACLTRLCADLTEVSTAEDGGGVTRELLHAFSRAEATVSHSEASDLLKAAVAVGWREQQKESQVVCWAVFCLACLLVVTHKHTELHPSSSQSHRRLRYQNGGSKGSKSCKYDEMTAVFLGGSCNPTSWRKDIVIPHLLREGISFYNPVDHWYPELIDIEETAKEEASKLLYVIDNQTRAVSSMVEVANFIGAGRKVLVVVNDIKGESPMIGQDVLSRREVEDLNRGRAFVRAVSKAGGSVVQTDIQRAVDCLVDVSRWGQICGENYEKSPSNSLSPENDLTSLRTQLSTKLKLLETVHTMYDSDRRGHLTLDECSVLLFIIGGDTLSVGSMAEVAYYIGQGRKMVLSLSDIPHSPCTTDLTSLEGIELSERAVRDYNRGRAYLGNMACRRGTPVFNNSIDAAICAVYMARGIEIPSLSPDDVPLRGTSV